MFKELLRNVTDMAIDAYHRCMLEVRYCIPSRSYRRRQAQLITIEMDRTPRMMGFGHPSLAALLDTYSSRGAYLEHRHLENRLGGRFVGPKK